MARIYNFIFSKIVKDDTDVVGHIAYALYKADKIKYINAFKQQHCNREPDEEELKPFHEISSQDDSISRYRLVAQNTLKQLMDTSLKENIRNIEALCYQNHAQILAKVIEPLKPVTKTTMFWYGVLQGVVGAFIFALIVAAFAFIKTYHAA
jgi:hypothetical protein